MTENQATATGLWAAHLDKIALSVATRLRDGPCPHGIPVCVLAEDVSGFVKGVTPVRPLCDACVMQAVRDAIEEHGSYP